MNQVDISIVVPTYQEADNLAYLVAHIIAGIGKHKLSWELIIANDESHDNTAAVCKDLATKYPVRLLNRTTNRGLALAVIDGVKIAEGKFIVVMDADLSHPASLIPHMIELLKEGKIKFAVGSRNIASASTDQSWAMIRRIGTFFATIVARPLTHIKDPMSGFFALKKEDWPTCKLNPIGYKIGLEIIVRGGITSDEIVELPIHFTDRKVGKSKMGLRELHNYIRHVLNLYRYRWPKFRVLMHGGIGLLGLIVDTLGFVFFQFAGLSHLGARLLSYWPAAVTNWWFNRFYTYDDRPLRPPVVQLIEFAIVSIAGFIVNAIIYYALIENYEFFESNKYLALVSGVGAGFILNFILSNFRVYKKG